MFYFEASKAFEKINIKKCSEAKASIMHHVPRKNDAFLISHKIHILKLPRMKIDAFICVHLSSTNVCW